MKRFSRSLNNLWNSQTGNTWSVFAIRTLSFFVVLPLILRNFNEAEISLWLLFSVIINLQYLMDLQFSVTSSRYIAYAYGGATEITEPIRKSVYSVSPNYDLISKIAETIKLVYFCLITISLASLPALGFFFLSKTIKQLDRPFEGWIAWGVIIVTSSIGFLNNFYTSVLVGVNQVALVRRWESVFLILTITSNFIAIILFKSFIAFIVSSQIWIVLNVLRNHMLYSHILGRQLKVQWLSISFDSQVLRVIWRDAWKSAVGFISTTGALQFSNLVIANYMTTSQSASYLLGYRLIQTISQFSQAPLYSKIPILSALRSSAQTEKHLIVAKKGYGLSLLAFIFAFIAFDLFLPFCLRNIESQAVFPSSLLWGLFGISFLLERIYGMNLNLLAIENIIIWHTGNFIVGVIFIFSFILLVPKAGVYSIPLAMLLGFLLFGIWYSFFQMQKVVIAKLYKSVVMMTLVSIIILCFYFGIKFIISHES